MSLNSIPRAPAEVTAITAILASVFNALPTILGIIAGLLGVVWYCVLFHDRFWKADTNHGKGAS